MVKIFVGNIADDASVVDLRVKFEDYGTVNECVILKNFAFVVSFLSACACGNNKHILLR